MSAKHRNDRLALLFIGALLTGFFLVGPVESLAARGHGGKEHGSGQARERERHDGDEFLDSRYRHDRYYPKRGFVLRSLPRTSHEFIHNSRRYRFAAGIWYRHEGARFIVATPPFGLIIPFLPPYYTTVWIGNLPYYYANEVYYLRRDAGYAVVAPPQDEALPTPPVAVEKFFIYPREGQSEKQQADDRYACHMWAVSQTTYDPTQPPTDATASPASLKQKRDDHQRAMAACLEGRGYTVK